MSNRDVVFISSFWQALFSVPGVDLLLSSAYHPQTDGQNEVLNRCLETYLRCIWIRNPKDWAKWLPLTEWRYNTNFHSTSPLTPYEVVYNQPPHLHLPYRRGESPRPQVDRSMQRCEQKISNLKYHLSRAQHRMKQLADKGRTDKEFAIGDWVWLKL